MKYRKLGASDLEVSEISLGSWLTYGVGVARENAVACVDRAFELGINFIDTANVYGRGAAETFLGEVLARRPRDSYILATKLYFPMSATDSGLSRAQIAKQIDASLQRLRLDHVDLYQCHRYDSATPIEETMQALSKVVRDGKARYIGFSEWSPQQIESAFAVAGSERFVSSQPQYSLLWRKPEQAVIPLCAAKGISQIVWSPLAQGVLSGKYLPGAARPPGSRASHETMGQPIQSWLSPAILGAVQRLKPLAQQAGCTLSQFALAWVLREPNVASAIVGASRPGQLQENAVASGLSIDPLSSARPRPSLPAWSAAGRACSFRQNHPHPEERPWRVSKGGQQHGGLPTLRDASLRDAPQGEVVDRAPPAKNRYAGAMAQLSDDCFAFGGPMLSVEDAVALLASRLGVVEGSESVALVQADGRVLAQDVTAPLPLPPFTNSAVDGYALRGEDLPVGTEATFAVVDWVQAGAAAEHAAAPGRAIRIFTGAPMPAGADTVFMQEDVRIEKSGTVILPPGLKRGANVRPTGEDIAEGQVVLKAGHRLRPQDIALAAGLGRTQLDVRRRIRVAVFSTGNEIVAPGAARQPVQLFDSNRFMLMAMLARLGCAVDDLGILHDDTKAIANVLEKAAAAHDLILTSGGVSTGEADYVKAAVESVGKLVFWRMAIKPGRPVAMGVIGGTPFIGLPGNPVASFVTFAYLARPAILALSGTPLQLPPAVPVRAAFKYRKKAGRREYVRVSLRKGDDGMLEAVKFPREGAGLLSSLVETDGLVELHEKTSGVETGQSVAFLAYSSLL